MLGYKCLLNEYAEKKTAQFFRKKQQKMTRSTAILDANIQISTEHEQILLQELVSYHF